MADEERECGAENGLCRDQFIAFEGHTSVPVRASRLIVNEEIRYADQDGVAFNILLSGMADAEVSYHQPPEFIMSAQLSRSSSHPRKSGMSYVCRKKWRIAGPNHVRAGMEVTRTQNR